MKKLELKMRDGQIFSFEKTTKNDNYIQFRMDYYDWAIPTIRYHIGDSRRFFNVDILCLHLEIWF